MSVKHLHPDDSDEQLLRQYRLKGNTAWLAELYGRYMPFVYGVSLKYLKNTRDAEDMVIQIYEELSVKLLQHEVLVFKAWLYTCVRNACLMELRRKSGNMLLELDEKVMEFCDDFNLDSIRQTEENERKLQECLEALPDKQRMCIQAFFVEEYSYKEIEDHSGFSLKMVKSCIQNGKRNLRLCLERKGIMSAKGI